MIDSFLQRKQDVLAKIDKSSIGKWDKQIISLCNKINKKDNYYTTSSCSGRVLLMIEQDKKGEDLFVFVSHDKISFNQLKKWVLLKKEPNMVENGKREIKREKILDVSNKRIKFKLEPCILHIACKTIDDAKILFEKGKEAGFKRLGIIGTSHGFTFELNSTEKLEFPIIQNKKVLVDDDFLKIIVKDANKKLEKSWMKIGKLEELM
ncbi:MAG: tRNA wybutosine-synthesizing 3 family protein [Nanoarchaeota archaeon]|mgnify:FL=1